MADTNLDIIIKARDEATATLKALTTQLDALKSKLSGLDASQTNISDELEDASKEAKGLADELDDAADSADKLAKESGDADDELDGASTSAQGLDQNLSNARVAAVALAAAVVSVGVAIVQATKGFFEFEKAVIEVGTLVDDTVISNQELRSTVRELSSEFGAGTTDVAQGLYQAISSGAAAGEEANSVLRASLVLAKGALVDTSTAVDVLTTATNSFESQGLTAGRASDILFATVKAGKTNLDQLAASLAQVTPIAGAVGVSFDEVNAAVAALTLGGTRTAQATTQIRAAIQGILRPTEELQTAFKNAGFESAQAALEQEGLAVAFDVVARAAAGDQGELQKLVGSVEGVNAILQTTGPNAQRFARVFDDITNSTGASDEAAKKVADTYQDRFAKAVNDISIAFDIFGEALAPIVTTLAEAVASAVTLIGEFIQKNQTLVQVGVVVVASIAAVVAAFGTLIVSVIAVRGAMAFLSGSAGFPLVTTALRAMGISALSTAGSMTTLGRVMALLRGGLTALVTGLRAALVGLVSLTGAFFAVVAAAATFIISTKNASQEVNDLADALDEASFKSRVFAQGQTIRSIGALSEAVKSVGTATKDNVLALQREIDLRKQQIELALDAAKKNLETQEAADTLFNDNSVAIEDAKKQVALYEDQLTKANTAMAATQQRLDSLNVKAKAVATQGLENTKKKAEELKKAFEAAQEGTNAFFEDLQELNSFKFDSLLNELQSQAELRKSLLETQGASAATIAEAELETSQQILALKEQEIAQRVALEERRVERQAQLISRNVTDEVDAANKIQALAQEGLASQIQATQDLVGIRQQTVDSARAQLASLASAAASTQAKFEETINGIQDRIRSANQIGLTTAQKFEQDVSQVSALGAQIRSAIANGEFDDAKKLVQERLALSDSLAAATTNEAGVALESDSARAARRRSELEDTESLVRLLNEKEQAELAAAQVETQSFIEKEKQNLEKLKADLESLGTLSQQVNLQTNFADTLSNLEDVQAALNSLQATAGGINIGITGEPGVIDILTGVNDVKVNFGGIDDLNTLVTAFETKITSALSEAERIAQLLNNTPAGTPGFAGGGSISGPGTGTSDSILARVSNGEYIIRQAAVSKFGVGFFDRLNSLRMPRFAEGGAVGAIPVSQTTRDKVMISLNLNKQTFDLESDRDTAQNMVKAFERIKTGLVGG